MSALKYAIIFVAFLLILTTVLLVIFAACSLRLPPQPKPSPYSTEYHILFDSKVDSAKCTANAVGPHTLLTAAHCIIGTGFLRIDGSAYHIASITYDEADHALIRLNGITFSSIARIASRALIPHEHVYFIGNPGRSAGIRRDGVYEGLHINPELGIVQEFQLAGYPGDSGSGILDDDGDIVAVLSLANESAEVSALPLEFTYDQIKEAIN